MGRVGPCDRRLEEFKDLITPFDEYDRESGLGASEIACVMGVGYTSAIMLAHRKRNKEPQSFPASMLVYLERGQIEEKITRDIYKSSLPLTHRVLEIGTLRHPDYPWAFCSPDGIVAHRRTGEWLHGLEIKTHSEFLKREYANGYPEKFEWQCRWSLWIVNACLASRGYEPIEKWDLFSRLGFFHDERHEVLWDMNKEAEMVEKAIDFWSSCVESDRVPQPTGHKDDRMALKSVYPEETTEEYVESDEVTSILAKKLHKTKREIKELTKKKSSYEDHLIHVIGDFAGIYGDGWSADYRLQPHGDGFRRTLKLEVDDGEDTSVFPTEDV